MGFLSGKTDRKPRLVLVEARRIELRLELIADTAATRSLVAVQVLDFEEDGLNIEYDILSSRNHDAQSPFSVG